MKKKCILLFSGGMDSTTLLYHLLEKEWQPHLFIINYGSKHNRRENIVAIRVACKLDLKYTLFKINYSNISKSALTNSRIEVPFQEKDKQILTVVPFRNTMFITLAASFSLSNNLFIERGSNKIYNIFISPVLDDYMSYRDCRIRYFKKLSKALTLGSVYDNQVIKINTPFIKMSKREVVKKGLKLGVNYSKTYTCYRGEKRPCLFCDACVERQEAFLSCGIKDPLLNSKEHTNYLERRK